MPDGLYERDALAWAEQQAALLRRLAAGERLNEAVDWAHVINEVQDVVVGTEGLPKPASAGPPAPFEAARVAQQPGGGALAR